MYLLLGRSRSITAVMFATVFLALILGSSVHASGNFEATAHCAAQTNSTPTGKTYNVKDFGMTGNFSHNACSGRAERLAIIHDEYENCLAKFAIQTANERGPVWIGLWRQNSRQGQPFVWVDCTRFDVFAPQDLNNSLNDSLSEDSSDECMSITVPLQVKPPHITFEASWTPQSCSAQLPVLCESVGAAGGTTTTEPVSFQSPTTEAPNDCYPPDEFQEETSTISQRESTTPPTTSHPSTSHPSTTTTPYSKTTIFLSTPIPNTPTQPSSSAANLARETTQTSSASTSATNQYEISTPNNEEDTTTKPAPLSTFTSTPAQFDQSTAALESTQAQESTQLSSDSTQTSPQTSERMDCTSDTCRMLVQETKAENFSVNRIEELLKSLAFETNSTTELTASINETQIFIDISRIENAENCSKNTAALRRFTVHCITSDTGTAPVLVVSAELILDPSRTAQSILSRTNVSSSNNSARNILVSSTGALIAISLYNADTGETLSPRSLQFSYNLVGDETLQKSARNISNTEGDGGILSTSHHVSNIGHLCATLNSTSNIFHTNGCGCVRNGTRIDCTSTHNSLFAVLFSVESFSVPGSLKSTTIVMQSISVLFLIVTFSILFRVRRRVRGERIVVQINLVVSLLMLHIWSLLHDLALTNNQFCEAVAVLTHFFLLSSALWMTVEAFLLFLKTSKWAFIQLKRRKVAIGSMSFAWGLAGLLVLLMSSIGFSVGTYMEETTIYSEDRESSQAYNVPRYDFCWLHSTSGIRIWGVVVPISLFLLFNLVVAIKVFVFVTQKSKESKNFRPTEQADGKKIITKETLELIQSSVKALILLFPVLGVPWILGFLTNIDGGDHSVNIAYVNAILNGLQGVGIFFVYCVVGKEVRSAAAKSFTSLTNSWLSFTDIKDRRRKKNSAATGDINSTPKNSVSPSSYSTDSRGQTRQSSQGKFSEGSKKYRECSTGAEN